MKNQSIIFRRPFGQLPLDVIIFSFFLLGNSSLLLSQQENPDKTKNDEVVMDTSAIALPSFFDDGNVNSFDDFQFVFGNGIVATQDQDAADKFAQLIISKSRSNIQTTNTLLHSVTNTQKQTNTPSFLD